MAVLLAKNNDDEVGERKKLDKAMITAKIGRRSSRDPVLGQPLKPHLAAPHPGWHSECVGWFHRQHTPRISSRATSRS